MENWCSLFYYFLFTPYSPSSPRQPPIHALHIWSGLFCTFHTNGILHRAAFCPGAYMPCSAYLTNFYPPTYTTARQNYLEFPGSSPLTFSYSSPISVCAPLSGSTSIPSDRRLFLNGDVSSGCLCNVFLSALGYNLLCYMVAACLHSL